MTGDGDGDGDGDVPVEYDGPVSSIHVEKCRVDDGTTDGHTLGGQVRFRR